MAICHGPVDAFLRIRTGTKLIWSGEVTTSSDVYIDQLGAYGGEEKEGGVQGNIGFKMGSSTELVDKYLSSKLDTQVSSKPVGLTAAWFASLTPEEQQAKLAQYPTLRPIYMPDGVVATPPPQSIPSFRNIASIIIKGAFVAANTPYLRPWSTMVRNLPSKGWLPNYAGIAYSTNYDSNTETIYDANPAHIIRECITNPIWGLGYPAEDIDDTSFTSAALTLFEEKFGLSFVWSSSVAIHEFITTIIQHIDGSLFVDPASGKFVLKLVRGLSDYSGVRSFDPSNMISVESYDRTSTSELINQVILLWHDTLSDKQRSITVHNMATRELQGSIISTSIEMPGISNADIALRVANRELRKFSGAFSRITFTCDRTNSDLTLGDVIKVSVPDYGIVAQYFRIAKIEFGTASNSSLRFSCVEDIFHTVPDLYAAPPSSLTPHTEILSAPEACTNYSLIEAPYLLAKIELSISKAPESLLEAGAGYLISVASAIGSAYKYELWTRIGTDKYKVQDSARFCSIATIKGRIGQELVSIITLSDPLIYDELLVGDYAFIDDEIVGIKALSGSVLINGVSTAIGNSQIAIDRGLLDTVPRTHLDAKIWFVKMNYAIDMTPWAEGVTVNSKALTVSGSGRLPLTSAPVVSKTIKRRWYLPYPPGKVQINGNLCPIASITARNLTISWEHRNRKLQTASTYLTQSDNGVLCEEGTTYSLSIRDSKNTTIKNETGLTSTSYTLLGGSYPSPLIIQLWSVRNGDESYQKQIYQVYWDQSFDVVSAKSTMTSSNLFLSKTDPISIKFSGNKVTGTVPKIIQTKTLLAGIHRAPKALLGCALNTGAATLEVRKQDGTILATVGGIAGGLNWRIASTGFTLTTVTDVDIVLYANSPTQTAIVNQIIL